MSEGEEIKNSAKDVKVCSSGSTEKPARSSADDCLEVHIKAGDTVLDLDLDTQRIRLASQVTGAAGKVICVELSEEALAQTRVLCEEQGCRNLVFRRGKRTDLQLNIDLLDGYLRTRPLATANDYVSTGPYLSSLRRTAPLIPSASVDVCFCCLMKLETEEKQQTIGEVYRVLKNSGRALFTETATFDETGQTTVKAANMQQALLDAGFYGLRILRWERSTQTLAVVAFKGKDGFCPERNQAIIFNGPFSAVYDDEGHCLERGRRYAVCDLLYTIFLRAPYAQYFDPVDPLVEVPLQSAAAFPCGRLRLRHPKETKESRLHTSRNNGREG